MVLINRLKIIAYLRNISELVHCVFSKLPAVHNCTLHKRHTARNCASLLTFDILLTLARSSAVAVIAHRTGTINHTYGIATDRCPEQAWLASLLNTYFQFRNEVCFCFRLVFAVCG